MKSVIDTPNNLPAPITLEEVFSIRKMVNDKYPNRSWRCKKWNQEMQEIASEIIREKVRKLIADKKWDKARLMSYSAKLSTITFSDARQPASICTQSQKSRFHRFILNSLKSKDFMTSRSRHFGTIERISWPLMERGFPVNGQEMKEKGVIEFSEGEQTFYWHPKKSIWTTNTTYNFPCELRGCKEYKTEDINTYIPLKYRNDETKRKESITGYYLK
jgi:hypothetical protein